METYPDCYLSFKAHDDYVSEIQLIQGMIITCSFDGGIRTWDSTSGESRHMMLGHTGGVRCMKVVGSVLFTGSEDCTVRSWNFRDGTPGISISGHTDWINCLDQSTDVLFSGSSDSTIRAWKIDSGDQVQSYVGHASSVNCLQVVDRVIYSGAYDMTLRAFDIVSGQCTMILKGDYIGSIRCLLVHNGIIYAGSEEGALRVLDPSSGKCLQQLRGHTAHIKSLRLNSSSDRLLSSSGDGMVRAWDLESRECIEYFANSNTCFCEHDGTFFVGSADGRVKVMRVEPNMNDAISKYSPVKESPDPEPPEPELALWEVVGAVDSVVRKTEATEAACASIPLMDQKVDQMSDRVDQLVQELEGLFDPSARDQGSVSELKQLRMEMQLLSDSVSRASQVSDIAHSAATSGQMGEHTAKALSLLEGRLDKLQNSFYSPTELPQWFNLASTELERALVLVEQSLERAIGTVAENHTEQVVDVRAQLKAEARARLQLEHATKDIADDMEELTASIQEQFKDMEQTVQRLELYDRGVVFQKKIDDALAECSRVLEDRLEMEGQDMSHGLEQINHRVDMAHDSVSALEKQMWQLWGTDTERAAKLPIPEGACVHQESELTEHDGSIVAATSILGLQSQLDGAKAELRDFRASIEGSLKGLAEAAPAEPASMQDLTGGLEGAKQHVAETVAVANEQISSLAGVVKSETNDLSSQIATLRAMCVVDLPDRWEEVKAACKTTRELEAELVPNVAQVEAGLGTSNEKIAKVEEVQAAHTNDLATHAQRASAIEEEHSRFVAQHAKLQEKVSHDIERLWEKLREALVEPPELPRDLVYESDLTRLRQALEARCNDVLSEASSLLASSQVENVALSVKVDELSTILQGSEVARAEAEAKLREMSTNHAELLKQQETLKMSVSTLVQQVAEEKEARGCLELVVNDMLGQCQTIIEANAKVVSMVNSSQQVASRRATLSDSNNLTNL